jgi:hypothetical protein
MKRTALIENFFSIPNFHKKSMSGAINMYALKTPAGSQMANTLLVR